jgi:hypothetical protein
MRGRKGAVCRDERNKRDYLIRKGVLPPVVYKDDVDTAWSKAGLLHII